MEETANGATMLETAPKIPIAQLNPLQSEPSTKAIKAVVTLTWPYSSATGTVAFLLSEPDFRLRRTRGQVRVQFSGSSAKAVNKSGIASGDEVILSLDGVEWMQNETTVATPGRGVDYELKFAERLLLQFKQEDSEEVKRIDIDHPTPEVETPLPPTILEPEPEIASPTPSIQSHVRLEPVLVDNEYSSPAFIKRARTSYGSMFDSDYDPFTEEDGTVPGRGRKRTRLSSSWRYSSRSATPEIEEATVEAEKATPESIPREIPVMTDEACQTTGLEEGTAAETLANFARQATNVGVSSYPEHNGASAPDELVEFSHQVLHYQPTEGEILEQAAVPQSPNIQPVPSDSNLEVFPILTPKTGLNTEPSLQTDLVQNNQVPNAQQEAPFEAGGTLVEDDIYTASPQRRISTSALASLNPPEETLSTEQPVFDHSYVPEHLYGHWQGETAQLSYPASPSRGTTFASRPEPSRDGQEEEFEDDEAPQSPSYEAPDHAQYPGLDNVLQDMRPTTWGPKPSSMSYPPLPRPNGGFEGEEEIYAPPPPRRSVAMSRSQSARSTAIDLTESSDEEEDQVENPMDEEEDYEEISGDEMQEVETHPMHPGPGYSSRDRADADREDKEGDDQGEDEVERMNEATEAAMQYAEEEEEEEDDDGYEMDDYSKAYGRNPENHPEYEDGEEFSDDEEDAQNAYLQGQDPAFQGDYYDEDEEEEESYDEEEESYHEEEDEGPPAPHAPVIIDLLSSDDEDDTSSPKLAPAASSVSVLQKQTPQKFEEEDEESGEDEEMEYEENLSYGGLPQNAKDLHQQSDNDEDEDDEAQANESEEDEDMKEETQPRHAAILQARQPSTEEDELEEEESDNPESEHEEGHYNAKTSHIMQEIELNHRSDQVEPNLSASRSLPPMPKPPPPRASLFSRMFNLDGANDEPPEEVSYPTLPEYSPPLPVARQEVPTRSLVTEPSEHNNEQLPTPDATQLSQKLLSPDSQLSETQVEAPVEASSQDKDGEPVEASHIHSTTIETENLEPITSFASTCNTAEIPPALTNKIQPVEFPTQPEVNTVISSAINGGTFESMEVEDTIILPTNDDTALPKIEQETETSLIAKDTAKVSIETVEHADDDTDELLAVDYPRAEQTLIQSHDKKQSGQAELTVEEPVYTRESPRRSHRRAKSTTSTAHTEDEVRPVTPNKVERVSEPNSLEKGNTSMVIINSQETPKGYHASVELSQETPKGYDASIELALSALDTPSKRKHDLRIPPVVDLKLRLSRILRTELSEFTSLKVLRYHINKKLDVLAVATSTPPEPVRAKSGPRNYSITFNVTDPSTAPSSVTQVQVFRPYKDALPAVQAGDGILLRNFQVIAVKNKGFGLKSVEGEGSSWAVFREGKEEVRGPPVEFGDGERSYMTALKGWYGGLDGEAKKKIMRANGEK